MPINGKDSKPQEKLPDVGNIIPKPKVQTDSQPNSDVIIQYETWTENPIKEYMNRGGAGTQTQDAQLPLKSDIENIITSLMQFKHTVSGQNHDIASFSGGIQKYDFFNSPHPAGKAARDFLKEGLDSIGGKHPQLAQQIISDTFKTFPDKSKAAHILQCFSDSPHEGLQMAVLKQVCEGPLSEVQNLCIIEGISKSNHAKVQHEMWRLTPDPQAVRNKPNVFILQRDIKRNLINAILGRRREDESGSVTIEKNLPLKDAFKFKLESVYDFFTLPLMDKDDAYEKRSRFLAERFLLAEQVEWKKSGPAGESSTPRRLQQIDKLGAIRPAPSSVLPLAALPRERQEKPDKDSSRMSLEQAVKKARPENVPEGQKREGRR